MRNSQREGREIEKGEALLSYVCGWVGEGGGAVNFVENSEAVPWINALNRPNFFIRSMAN
jgi:hypothetical protein